MVLTLVRCFPCEDGDRADIGFKAFLNVKWIPVSFFVFRDAVTVFSSMSKRGTVELPDSYGIQQK